jgi:hypothetical protein
MALASFVGAFKFPEWPGHEAAAPPAFTATLLDAAGEYISMVVRAPKAGTIKKAHFTTGTVTTGATLDVTIEGVSATDGQPDGTPLTNGTTTVVVADTDDNAVKTATFATGPTVTAGQLIALKIANPAVSPGNLNINRVLGPLAAAGFPYAATSLAGVPDKQSAIPVFGLEYSDGSFPFIAGVYPTTALGTDAITTATTPDEVGLRFAFPVPVKISGIWCCVTVANAAAMDVVLYDSDGSSVLKTISVDEDQLESNSASMHAFMFDAEVTLTKDLFYRAVIKPTAGTVTTRDFAVPTAAQMDAFMGGQNFHKTERTDAGAWTNTTTERPWIGVLVSALDDGAGASGGGLKLVGTGGLAG